MEVNRIQLILLSVLQHKEANSPATSLSIANIQEVVQLNKSYSTIYREMNVLHKHNYISTGVKDGKYKTFFINENGKNIIKEMK